MCSGKTGEGIHELLRFGVFGFSSNGRPQLHLRRLFLTHFDQFRGVVATVRALMTNQGHDQLLMMQWDSAFSVEEVGAKRPLEAVDQLSVGEVGHVVTGLKDPEAVRVGDTLTYKQNPRSEPLPGYREAKPMVFTGLFPVDNKQYENS